MRLGKRDRAQREAARRVATWGVGGVAEHAELQRGAIRWHDAVHHHPRRTARARAHPRHGPRRRATSRSSPAPRAARRALGIAGLDRAIFGEWLPAKPRVRHLIGASIGAWRFAAACCRDPARGARRVRARLHRAALLRRSPAGASSPTAARALLGDLFAGREEEILASPATACTSSRCAGAGRSRATRASRTPLGFGMAAMANVVGRRHLARFIDRTVFLDARERPPLPAGAERFDAFHTHAVPLDAATSREALLASASIPLVLEGVADIPERARRASTGTAASSTITCTCRTTTREGLVLYPHFTDRIVPGLARQGDAVAARARRVARQRGAGGAVARVPREAAARQASRPQGLHALRARLRGADDATGAARSARASAWPRRSSSSRAARPRADTAAVTALRLVKRRRAGRRPIRAMPRTPPPSRSVRRLYAHRDA